MFGAFPGPRGGQSREQAVLALETQIGRPLAGVRVFDLWNTPFPDAYTTWLRDTGHTVFLSVKAKRVNGSTVLWRDIANAQPGSTLYNQIVGWATSVKAFGAPMYFIFNHEPEAGASDSNGSAQEFIAAWRQVITIFRDQGVTNAKYVWTMTDYAFWRTDGGRADLWYPGDAYVDAIASDSYNWSNCRPGHQHRLAFARVDRWLDAGLRPRAPRQAADVDGVGVARGSARPGGKRVGSPTPRRSSSNPGGNSSRPSSTTTTP